MVGGRKKLSGRQEDVRTKVTLSICKNIVPETDRLKAKAYERIATELSSLDSGGTEKLAPGSLLGRNQPSGLRRIALPGLLRRNPTE